MSTPFSSREWYRRRDGKMIAGVAVGLAEQFGLPLAFVRLMFLLSLLLGGGGLVAYLACWLVMPLEPTVLLSGASLTPAAHVSESVTDE